MTALLTAVTAIILILNQSVLWREEEFLPAMRWVCLGLFIPLLMLRGHAPRLRMPQTLDSIAIGTLLLALISTAYSEFPDVTWQRAVSAILLYVSVFWTIWNYVDKAGEQRIVSVLIAVGAIAVVSGFLYFPGELGAWQDDGRFRGIFINPNSLALFICIFLPLVLWRCLEYRSIFYFAILGVMGIALLLTQSRNGVLASTIGVGYLLFRIKGVKAAAPTVGALLIIVAYLAVGGARGIMNLAGFTGDDAGFERLSFDPESLGTGSGRLEAFDVYWPLIKERWFLGYGFGTEEFAFDWAGYFFFEEFAGQYFHNSYMGFTYQLGILGSILFFGPVLLFIAHRMRLPNQIRQDSAVYAYEAVMLTGLVAGLFESWLYSVGNAFSFPFWICVMLIIRRSRLESVERLRNVALGAAWNVGAARKPALRGARNSRIA